MTSMDKERYGLKSGRKRPPYTPKNIRCESCGAGLSVKDERAELVVCDYCGSHLDVSGEQQKVVGKKGPQDPYFSLDLGDSFRYQAARFEVIARMAYTEDGDIDEMTKAYLIYNPYCGTRWLGEYRGQFSITQTSHVMPATEVFDKQRGDVIQTHDGQQWVAEGTGVYDLVYVDGALPWIATVGDRIQYAEFAEKSGGGAIYEAERIDGEIEYGMGRRLPVESVRRAAKKPKLGEAWADAHDGPDPARVRKHYMVAMLVAFVGLLVNAGLGFYCYMSGRDVLSESFPAQMLTGGHYSKPFVIHGKGDAIRITAASNVDNAWMSLVVRLIRADEMMVDELEQSIEYYHGRSGDENWSEGSRSASTMVKIPDPGTYRIFVQAVSARGEAATADKALHDVRIRVRENALPWDKFAVAGGISLGLLILSFALYAKWRQDDDED